MVNCMHLVKSILFISMAIFISACTSMPRIYSGEEVHGWVVDSKTKEPIEDVVVVIAWELEGGFIHTDHTANIHIAEAVTDTKGHYSFDNWGPRITVDGRRSRSTPRLVFYKFGYKDAYRLNSVSGNLNPDNSVSEHSGKIIELTEFTGKPAEYKDIISSIDSVIGTHGNRRSFMCTWKKIPRFTSEMVRLNEFFSNQRPIKYQKMYPSTYLNNLSNFGCENPEIILKEYLK